MLQLVLAAPRSGSGKTTAACALLAALTARGLTPCAFKSGPDYIDPMFHRAVLGVESHNLDLFFSAPQTARALYARHAAGHGAAVVEGAMGYYDGLGGVGPARTARCAAQGGKPDAGGGAARADGVPYTAPYRRNFAQ